MEPRGVRFLISLSELHKFMKESAVVRTPVEIWRHIIQYAAHFDLLPEDGDSDVWKFTFFSEGCRRYHQYADAEAIRTRLRLVNRNWNRIVKEIGHHYILTDLETQVWPSEDAAKQASYFEYYRSSSIFPGIEGRCHRHREKIVIKGWEPTMFAAPRSLRNNTENAPIIRQLWGPKGAIRARILLLEKEEENPLNVLERAPELEALALNVSQYDNSALGYIRSDNAATSLGQFNHQRLTHLRLHNLTYKDLCDTAGCFSFPALKHLELRLDAGGRVRDTHIHALDTWEFPSLSILWVKGYITKEVGEDFERMVFKVSATLRMMVVDINYENDDSFTQPWIGSRELWASLLNLTLLGIDTEWLLNEEWFPTAMYSLVPNVTPLTLYFHDFFGENTYESHRLTRIAQNLVKLCARFPRTIGRVAINATWEELADIIAGIGLQDLFIGFRLFFRHMIDSRISFSDKNDVYLGEATRPFLEGLELGEFSADYVVPIGD